MKLNEKVIPDQREYFKLAGYTLNPSYDCCKGLQGGNDVAIATLDRPVSQKFFHRHSALEADLPLETTAVTKDWLEITGWGESK